MPGESKTPLAERFDAKLELCFGILLADGTLACGAAPGAPASITFGGEPVIVNDEEVRFDGLQAPAELAELPPPFDDIDRIALFGALCVDGKVERVPGKQVNADPVLELYRCTGSDDREYPDPYIFTLSVLLDLGDPGDDNHHPSFSCEAPEGPRTPAAPASWSRASRPSRASSCWCVPKRQRGSPARPWPGVPARTAPYPGATVPRAACPPCTSGTRSTPSGYGSTPGSRELQVRAQRNGTIKCHRRPRGAPRGPCAHDLGGKLERHFSIIEKDVPDAEAELELAYTPPGEKDEAADGLTATGQAGCGSTSPLRDERGGVDYITRELCLLPK
jgi:hypothetical protein